MVSAVVRYPQNSSACIQSFAKVVAAPEDTKIQSSIQGIFSQLCCNPCDVTSLEKIVNCVIQDTGKQEKVQPPLLMVKISKTSGGTEGRPLQKLI